MPLTQAHINYLSSLLPASAIINPSNPEFANLTQVWLHQLQRSPSLVVRPPDLPSLQTLVEYLYSSAGDTIDFAIRNGGVGSASAKDLLIDTSTFNSFSFSVDWEDHDKATGEATVILGAGQLWEHADRAMKAHAQGWALVGARSQFTGVAGYLIMGGLSWYSNEWGMGSDPQNWLDARVVLTDGRVVWAAEEAPEVMWAMRGGRTAFGVITHVKLRARRLETTNILAGDIIYPITSLEEVSRRVSTFVQKNDDPKMALYVFLLNPLSPFFPAQDGVGIIVYDRHGPLHARSSQGFKWAYDIPGAQDLTRVMDFAEVNELTNFSLASRGRTHAYHAAGIAAHFDAEMVLRGATWLRKVVSTDPALAAGTFVIFEPMGKATFDARVPASATAWPHPETRRFVVQLGCGFLPELGEPEGGSGTALRLLKEAFEEIPLEGDMGSFRPVCIEPFMDVEKMYGPNLDRLKEVSRKYDPKNKFKSGLW